MNFMEQPTQSISKLPFTVLLDLRQEKSLQFSLFKMVGKWNGKQQWCRGKIKKYRRPVERKTFLDFMNAFEKAIFTVKMQQFYIWKVPLAWFSSNTIPVLRQNRGGFLSYSIHMDIAFFTQTTQTCYVISQFAFNYTQVTEHGLLPAITMTNVSNAEWRMFSESKMHK